MGRGCRGGLAAGGLVSGGWCWVGVVGPGGLGGLGPGRALSVVLGMGVGGECGLRGCFILSFWPPAYRILLPTLMGQ